MTHKIAFRLYLLFLRNNSIAIISTVCAISAAAYKYGGMVWYGAISTGAVISLLLPLLLVAAAVATQKQATLEEWLSR
ncbi:hypothetical protein [Maricurvus nonylphenolicus]|jgi:hypothetical protein|uniref:hypothetical protein n=1 Tax=Maricurvus nonylphenolicus TaxID=1008307 RepID=UPI0036F439D7